MQNGTGLFLRKRGSFGMTSFASLLFVAAIACCVVFSPLQNAASASDDKEPVDRARAFLSWFETEMTQLCKPAAEASWQAAVTGESEAFADAATKSLAIRTFLSDSERYDEAKELLESAGSDLTQVELRQLELAERAFRANQLPPELLKEIVELSIEIEQTFNTFRGELDGEQYSNNELLDMLREETDSARREEIWGALKQVGAAVAPMLIELAELRNEAAQTLGFNTFWEMKIYFQEHDVEQLLAIFDELEELTNDSFAGCKDEMDAELGRRFTLDPESLMPWHYDNPFFQQAPPSEEIDLNVFYEEKTKEAIADISAEFFGDIGLPVEQILSQSDLYEREGKDQHAFCTSIDRLNDVRILCNLKPTAEWMDTQLHELGHAVYDVGINRDLPFSLRDPAHAFTTEGVAMFFGALGKNPDWMIHYADADPADVEAAIAGIQEQRRREQLVFARWTLVMLNFEKSFYEDPQQDLNKLWWDYVERFQGLTRPEGRDLPDWAAKPHFTIAPVYYHNYMLGELFAAQLRQTIGAEMGVEAAISCMPADGDQDQIGDFFRERVFGPGSLQPWPPFVEAAAGEPLTARYFAEEVKPNAEN